MTKLGKMLCASITLGLTITSTALAQSPPATGTTNDSGTSGQDGTTGTTSSGTTGPTTTGPPVDVDADANVNGDMSGQVPAPVDVDVNVQAPPPPPQPPSTEYISAPTTVMVDDDDSDDHLISGLGIAIAAGGGAGGFTNDEARNATNPGGDWDVRATIGTRSPIAFEGSYIGSAQSIDALGLTNDAVLIGNGVQGALRVNATLNLPVQPFLFAGAAWRHYNLNADTNLSDVNDSDDVLEIPMGVGLAGRWKGLILDARGEFRASAAEDLIAETSEDEVEDFLDVDQDQFAPMHRWGVKATVGFEF